MGVTELALDHVEWPRLRAPSRQRERGGADEGDAVLRAIERTLAGRPENEVIQRRIAAIREELELTPESTKLVDDHPALLENLRSLRHMPKVSRESRS